MLAAPRDVDRARSLLTRLAAAREQTDQLFKLVRPGSLYERPIPERNRIIFYVGHLEAFDWNLLQPQLPGAKRFDPTLDRLFAFGIDPVDGGLPSDQPEDWPVESQVGAYRDRIRATLDASLKASSFSDTQLLNVAIEHRLMHAETLAYMLHQLPHGHKGRESQALVALSAPPLPEMIQIPEGFVTQGISRSDPSQFGWDNEYEEHSVRTPSFGIDRYKVTNGQYLKFMEAGGYSDRSLWQESDWVWINRERITHPVFWHPDGSGWRYRAMFEELPLNLDWPVYVSHAEASAYARWANKRLPTEAEWQRAAYGSPEGIERRYPWGKETPGPEHGYFDFGRWDPVPVNAFPKNRSAFGVEGMLANGWEWTSSVFEPFAGFERFPFYPGYSADFFDGKHYVMKGGSTRTAECMLRRSFRNWFQPHYQYVYAGFRCALD
jgi:ergothioneine biosynthesis protein EgtB